MATKVALKPMDNEETEEDEDLRNELKLLVDRIIGQDPKLILPALEMLKYLIRTSTTSMTSVPKPLKYLTPYYQQLKKTHEKMEKDSVKLILADVISVLAMGTAGGDESKENLECLKYCVLGTMENIGDWGHEYIRQLESEIIQQWLSGQCEKGGNIIIPLIKDVITFNCTHHAEIQACDLLMEIDQLDILPEHVNENNYQRMVNYLLSCAKYVDDTEKTKIMKISYDMYMKFNEFSRALIIGIQINNNQFIEEVFEKCQDRPCSFQMAFVCARNLIPVNGIIEDEDLASILSNSMLSGYFLNLSRELDIMEPKSPEDVYKTWLDPLPQRLQILGDGNVDSARQNLASSFVNGFVNAGFGCDKLLSNDTGNKWIYRNKDHCMLSATASLGLIHLWDVDGGLTPIDKYLYSGEDYIKSGALLALGIVNCRVKNECDPALALLGDYISKDNEILRIGAILGIGLAYAGSQRADVLDHLIPLLVNTTSPEIQAITSLAAGLVSLGDPNSQVPSIILDILIDGQTKDKDFLKCHLKKLMALGSVLSYFGAKDDIGITKETMDVFNEPFKSLIQTMLYMLAYAGSGDVLMIQQLLSLIGDKVEDPPEKTGEKPGSSMNTSKMAKKARRGNQDWDWQMGQAIAALAVATIGFGEEIGIEMMQRILGHMGRYGEPSIRKAVPLAVALASVSNPQLPIFDVLLKYSHDSDDEVACNAIFGLGLIGAGTNNARLAASLRQLAIFHTKNPPQLFMVRLAQGLVHMGKGTMTLNPLNTDRMLIDKVGMAGLLIVAVSLLEPHSLILSKHHYLLYCLAVSIQPRWLLALDEDLNIVQTTVRVGQAVDVVGKAGTPKTIAGIHTNTTPVLLAVNERAELVTDQYEQFSSTLDGICILRKNPDADM